MNKPKSIFKYFTEDRIDLLQNGLIKFSPPHEFNDPFEAYPSFKSMAPHETIDELVENFDSEPGYHEKILEDCLKKDLRFQLLPESIQNYMAVLAKKKLEKIRPEMSKQIKEFASSAMKFQGDSGALMIKTMLSSINKSFAILCFTEKKDNLLMWSHYANSHKGFVLEFLPKHPFFNHKNGHSIAGHLRKVRYTLKRPEFILFDDELPKEQVTQNWIDNLIWVKSEHWAYEEEWRILSTQNRSEKTITTGESNIHLFSLPFDAIKNIYFGCKMKDERKNEFITLIESEDSLRHIKIFKAIPDEKEYKLRFIEQGTK